MDRRAFIMRGLGFAAAGPVVCLGGLRYGKTAALKAECERLEAAGEKVVYVTSAKVLDNVEPCFDGNNIIEARWRETEFDVKGFITEAQQYHAGEAIPLAKREAWNG